MVDSNTMSNTVSKYQY